MKKILLFAFLFAVEGCSDSVVEPINENISGGWFAYISEVGMELNTQLENKGEEVIGRFSILPINAPPELQQNGDIKGEFVAPFAQLEFFLYDDLDSTPESIGFFVGELVSPDSLPGILEMRTIEQNQIIDIVLVRN